MPKTPNAKEREDAIDALETSVDAFAACVASLPKRLFLVRMNGWSARDVVAHLIGWNRLTVIGCGEILSGSAPTYLDDVDQDFLNVNASSVREYDSENRGHLLDQLRQTAADAVTFVRSLDANAWRTGIRFRRFTIRVADCYDGLRQDYDTHRMRIEAWISSHVKREERT